MSNKKNKFESINELLSLIWDCVSLLELAEVKIHIEHLVNTNNYSRPDKAVIKREFNDMLEYLRLVNNE